MTAPLKALPPASVISVTDALDMALEGMSIAIKQTLDQRESAHRFTEVKRLATIGQAIGRQRARTTNRVDDFAVGDRRYQCGVGDPDLGDLRELDRDEELPPMPPGVGQAVYGDRGPGWIGAPRNVAEPNMGGMVGEMLGAMQPMINQIQAKNERDAERAERRDASESNCAQAQELEALMTARDRAKTDDERLLVQCHIDRLLTSIDEPEPEPESEPEAEPEPEPAAAVVAQVNPAAPELQIRCQGCGNVHGRHWVTHEGGFRVAVTSAEMRQSSNKLPSTTRSTTLQKDTYDETDPHLVLPHQLRRHSPRSARQQADAGDLVQAHPPKKRPP